MKKSCILEACVCFLGLSPVQMGWPGMGEWVKGNVLPKGILNSGL